MFLKFDSFSNLEYLAGFTTVAGLKKRALKVRNTMLVSPGMSNPGQ